MKSVYKAYVAGIVFSITILIALPGRAVAIVPNSVTVAPAFINAEISNTTPKYRTQVSITNSFSTDIKLAAELRGIDEVSGNLIPVGAASSEILASVKLSKTELTIPANSTTLLDVLIANSVALSPGGHYATLTLSELTSGVKKNSIRPVISINVFIIKKDGEVLSVDLQKIDLMHSLFALPKDASFSFHNTGNVHNTPRAVILLESLDGKKVYAKGIANQESRMLLPDKSFTTMIGFTKLYAIRWPTKVKALTTYRSDGSDVTKQYEQTFWYIPPSFCIYLFVGTITSLVLIRNRSKIKKYIHLPSKKKIRVKPNSTPVAEELIEAIPIQLPAVEVSNSPQPIKKSKSKKKPSKKKSKNTRKA